MVPSDVKPVPASVPVYDAGTLRTVFLQFENEDWEDELTDFYHTDVDVPATVTIDPRLIEISFGIYEGHLHTELASGAMAIGSPPVSWSSAA